MLVLLASWLPQARVRITKCRAPQDRFRSPVTRASWSRIKFIKESVPMPMIRIIKCRAFQTMVSVNKGRPLKVGLGLVP